MITRAFVLVAALAAFPLPALAAKTVDHQKVVGNGVLARWQYTEGSIATSLSVTASNNNVRDDGVHSDDGYLIVEIVKSDLETGELLLAGLLETSNFSLVVDKKLGSATLLAAGMFSDEYTFLSFPLMVNLTWTATSDLTKQNSHFSIHDPGFMMNFHSKGEFRTGTATGSVFGNDTNFTPVPSRAGLLQRNSTGTVTGYSSF